MNSLTADLAAACRAHLLDTKWLLAPSRRVGQQWIDQVVRSGQGVLNLPVQTPAAMAMELAAGAVARRGLTVLGQRAALVLIDSVLTRIRQDGKSGYLLSLQPGPTLTQCMYSSIQALRLAGLAPRDLAPANFESPAKARELAFIFEQYTDELAARKLVDYAGVLELAQQALPKDGAVPGGGVVLVPSSLELSVLEKALLDRIAPACKIALGADEPPGPTSNDGLTDARRLAWLNDPASAPPPVQDGSAEIFHAIGEINEVREVLRRCLQRGIALDDVEILHTDSQVYLPLIFETLQGLSPAENLAQLPVTFGEGIYVRYSRPARAMAAWIEWLGQDCPQATLVRMLQDGLLSVGESTAPGFAALARLLRSIPIGFGRTRYLPMLQEHKDALQSRLKDAPLQDEDGQIDAEYRARLESELGDLRHLERLVRAVLLVSPQAGDSPAAVLRGAEAFVKSLARSVNELDALSAIRLREDIGEMAALLEQGRPSSLDPWAFLQELLQTTVGGSGPRGGRLHVAHVLSGGHSGRGHTFIIGLGDHRFPGAGLQDPLVLDGERRKLSPGLPTAADDMGGRLKRLSSVLAGLRGHVTLSFSSHDIAEDRQTFASPALLGAYRVLSGKLDADQGRLMQALGAGACFVPQEPAAALNESDWWMSQTLGQRPIAGANALAGRFPNLARGRAAVAARASDRFTAFDGLAPQAGSDHDPAREGGRVLSASSLETAGKCPLAYFFRYVLNLQEPEELTVDPSQWLDALQNGSLLHEVFCRFMRELSDKDMLPPVAGRDQKLLHELLAAQIERFKRLSPPPSQSAYRRRCRELNQAVRIFLADESEFCRHSTPTWMEASIGLPGGGTGILPVAHGQDGHATSTSLDSEQPLAIELEHGRSIRVRGRLDRIDKLASDGRPQYAVWDYKTGSNFAFRRRPPFDQGRVIQHWLYMQMAQQRIGQLVPGAEVALSGYFLPGHRGGGQRLRFSPQDLADGRQVVSCICGTIASGAFAATDNAGDCNYCSYSAICGDVNATAEACARKLAADDSAALEHFRGLRCDDEQE